MSRQIVSVFVEVDINAGDATPEDIASYIRRQVEGAYPEARIEVEIDSVGEDDRDYDALRSNL